MKYRFLRFPEGKFKDVTFSYDDGVKADIRLAEIFNKYGMKGTFNINSRHLVKGDAPNRLTVDEIKEYILGAGHEVAIHGAQHIAPGCSRPVDAIRDVLDCREELEDLFGMIIRGMAYPDSGIRRLHNGNDYETVKGILENLGVIYSRTLGGDSGNLLLPTDWHAWMPNMHHNNPEGFGWIEAFLGVKEENTRTANRHPRIFYIWGHAYEFNNDNNWDLIEKICETLAGKDDIWYATNIDICEYVKAYESLVWSAKGDRVYNPTQRKIWFDIDGRQYSVEPGETLFIVDPFAD